RSRRSPPHPRLVSARPPPSEVYPLSLHDALPILAGADDDVVYVQHLRLAVDGDVQALVVDAVVGDTDVLVHAGLLQLCAVHPAGGLAQALADRRLLALQQMHLAQRLLVDGLAQAAGRVGGVDDAPRLPPLLERLVRLAGEVLGDVDADAARADDRHARAGGAAAGRQLVVGDHRIVVDAGDL